MLLGKVNYKDSGCITPDGTSTVQELVMLRLEQQKDAERQKPSLTGAGIGSGAATRNESQRFLMKLHRHSPCCPLINLVFPKLI